MATTAGALTLVSVGSTTANLSSAAATGGTAPYTLQWYRSTTTGFSVGPSNILSGATSPTLADTLLIPNTNYFYKVVATDSSSPTVSGTSAQLAVTTLATTISQNQFVQAPVVGQVDMPYNFNTFSAQIDVTASTAVYTQGTAMKIVANTKGGIPRVIACSGNTDNVFGFINFNIKNVNFAVGQALELSTGGNVIWLYATTAITQGAQVCLDVTSPGGVQATGNSATVVGMALDGATGYGSLIRVRLNTPSFATA